MDSELRKGFYLRDLLVMPGKGQISGRSGLVHLPPNAIDVLVCLASHPGELVTREMLIETIWGENAGGHEALQHAVTEIRQALDDQSADPRFLEEVANRGYRLVVVPELQAETRSSVAPADRKGIRANDVGLFENLRQRGVLETVIAYLVLGWLLIQVADIVFEQLLFPLWAATFVTVLVIAGFPIAIALSWFLEFRDGRAVPHDMSPDVASRRQFSRTYLSVISALGIAAVVVFIYDKSVGLPTAEITRTAAVAKKADLPPVRENSIAVLPFLNVDGTAQTEIFAKGLADDLITSLSRVPGLLVSSRGDSFTLSPNSGSAEVRERLRVSMYLEGSVHVDGDMMRIIVQLIDSESGFHVVARRIDRPISNFFRMRDEIAEFTVANVRVALPPAMQLAPILEPDASTLNAYVAYRHGKELFEQPRTIDSLADVIELYEQALQLDPEYSAAHAGLCAVYVARFQLSNSADDIRHAEAACARALELNQRIYVVHTALGDLSLQTGQTAEAKTAYNEALVINPQDVEAMAGLAQVYKLEQRYDDAEGLLRRAVDMQPGNWRAIRNLGSFLFSVGRYGEAADAYRQVVQLDPDNQNALVGLGGALSMAGEFEAGRQVFEDSLAMQESEMAYSNLGVIYYYLGDFRRSIGAHTKAVELSPRLPVNWFNLADAMFHAGDTSGATAALEKGAELANARIAVDPNDADTLFMLAWARSLLGDLVTGRELIERGLSIAPNDPYGLYYAALINVRAGNFAAAVNTLRLAIDNGYPVKMLAAEPYLSTLRKNQEFEALLDKSE